MPQYTQQLHGKGLREAGLGGTYHVLKVSFIITKQFNCLPEPSGVLRRVGFLFESLPRHRLLRPWLSRPAVTKLL
jgi:hypothetical protein